MRSALAVVLIPLLAACGADGAPEAPASQRNWDYRYCWIRDSYYTVQALNRIGALDVLESRWISHLHGPLDMGQIATGCALGYLDFRHYARGWRDGHPRLSAWEADFAARPAMQATKPVA